MKTFLVLIALIALALAIPHQATLKEEWREYKESFGKFYTSYAEDQRRWETFLKTKQMIEEHNLRYKRGETSFDMGINQFADWFPEELSELNGVKIDELTNQVKGQKFKLAPGAVVPKEINWTEKGAVTSVKSQGRCGSCYAFSAVGALEAMMYNANKTIIDLSPQEFVDCTRSYGNLGCKGGHSHICYEYVIEKKGISTEKSYPYEGIEGTCRAQNGKFGTVATDHVLIEQYEEEKMVEAVGTVAPISIYFGAGPEFHAYKSGVFDGRCLNGSSINHAMLAVGYGRDKASGKDYWLVKNSWGKNWGMDGYVKIVRGKAKCGIDSWSTYPVYKKK